MNKEIIKNREGLIRHFICLSNNTNVGCAKGITARYLKFEDPYPVTSLFQPPKEVNDYLEMTTKQWDDMERYYENWEGHPGTPVGPRKSYMEVANYLQELPDWPTVL